MPLAVTEFVRKRLDYVVTRQDVWHCAFHAFFGNCLDLYRCLNIKSNSY